MPTVGLPSLWLSPSGASRNWGQLVHFLIIFFITTLSTSKCGKNSSITLLTPNKNFSHFHPLNNKERKVMIVEFYWLYLNKLLLPQQYCATTIKLFWHITLNISAWTCQLCTSGATVQCQELLVTLRSLFTIRRREGTASESSGPQCCPVALSPSSAAARLTHGAAKRGFLPAVGRTRGFGEGELSFPQF